MVMKTMLFFVLALFTSLSLKAQDTLVLNSGKSIIVRINKVSDSHISYVRENEHGKAVRSKIPRSMVSEIHWRNARDKAVDWNNKQGLLIGIPFSEGIKGVGVGLGFSGSFNRHVIKLQGELVNGKKSDGPIREIPRREFSHNIRLTYGYNLASNDVRLVVSTGVAYLSRREKGAFIDENIHCPEYTMEDVFLELITLGLYDSGECTGTRTFESLDYDSFGIPLELNLGLPLDKRRTVNLEFQFRVIISPEVTTTGGGAYLHF
jgi:hypothetical protein